MSLDYLNDEEDNYFSEFYDVLEQEQDWEDVEGEQSGHEDRRKKNFGSFVPSHLAMPITNDDTNFLLKYETFYCPRHVILRQKIDELNVSADIYNLPHYDPYILIQKYIEKNVDLRENHVFNELLEFVEVASTSVEVHKIDFIGRSISPKILHMLKTRLKNEKEHLKLKLHEIRYDYIMMKKVERIKDEVCAKRIPFGQLLPFNKTLLIERDVFFLQYDTDKWTIGSTNLFLCVLDIYQARFVKKLYWILSDFNKKYPLNMFEIGCHLIKEFEHLRSLLKNDFFKFISTWESLIIGFSINDSEMDLGFSELYDTSLQTMQELLASKEILYDISRLLPPSRNTDDIKMYIELLGNTKHFGHPCLEVKSGFDNVRRYGTEAVSINLEIAQLGASIMRRDFVKNFILKRRKWPPSVKLPTEFSGFFRSGKYPNQFEKRYDLWAQIKFGRVFDYDLSPDTSELIKDSSAADDFETWFADYDSCAFRHLYQKQKPSIPASRKPTRVIQRYLEGGENDLPQKIHELKNNHFSPRDSTACLCRKEQELKPDGRLFVKQPYLQRLAQTSMEANIANQYMKYVPEQTMTDGEIQLMRRLADTAKNQKKNTLEIFNLDLSKWNMRFRHALVYWYGQVLDELFDTGVLFSNNHLWFITSKVFCNSRLAPPDYNSNLQPIPGDFFYDNHLGGMEGMRQKLWTIITINLIKLSAEQENLSINIMCQGDNQVVMVNYPICTRLEKREKREHFLNTLSSNLQEVNLSLKREETWFSMRLCEFGKIRYFDGEAISNCDKKINRCIPDINDGVSSFMSSLSTINTITEATAKCDYSPDSSFLINQIMVLNYLQRKGVLHPGLTKLEKTAYLFHPTDFGGISLSTYFSHTIRGYDDKLTLWLSLITTLKNQYPNIFELTCRLNKGSPKPGLVNLEKLVEDIFSLNITNLPSVEQKMKNLALAYLSSNKVTNPEVRNIFLSSSIKTKTEIVNQLSSMEPFIPSLAHELLRNSNTGILLALRNQFSNLTTINKIVQELTPPELKKITRDITYIENINHNDTQFDFLEIANINNKIVINILKKRIKNTANYYLIDYLKFGCPTLASSALRRNHWGLNIVGSSKPYPPCQFTLKELDVCISSELDQAILVTLSEEYAERDSVNYLKDGPFIAYLGSATKEKVKKPTLDVVAKTSFTKSLQQLHLIKSWCIRLQAPNLTSFVDELIKEKNTIVPDELHDFDVEDWCAMVWGGNILHRFRSMIEKDAAVINFLPTQATHIKQTTNNLASLTAGGKDFTIHFQMIMIYNIITLSLAKEYDYLGIKQFASVACCNGCTQEVTSISVDLRQAPTSSNFQGDVLLLQEKIRIQELTYSNSEVTFAVSIHLGRIFGSSYDLQFMQHYIIDKVVSDKKLNSETAQVSINDLRYIQYEYFIPAMISRSKVIKSSLLHYNPVKLSYQRSRCFEILCTFFLNAKMLESFLSFLHIRITEHYQGLDPQFISATLLPGIFSWFSRNCLRYGFIFMDRGFLGDNTEALYENQKWYLSFLLRHKKGPQALLRQLKFSYDSIILNKSMIQNILKFPVHFNLGRRMEEDKATYYLRTKISCEEIMPQQREKIIQFIDYPHESLVHHAFLLHLISYYHDMESIVPGNERYKEIQHISRPFGTISTAINKILELIVILGIKETSIKNIYCLAEGSGSILEGLGSLFPESKLFYNTLLTPSVDLRQGADQDYPPAILTSRAVTLDRLVTSANLAKGETDITKDKFLDKLERSFAKYPPTLISMDAESNEISENGRILDIHLPLLMRYKINYGFYKLFLQVTEIPNTMDWENQYPDYYFFLVKPMSSNLNNSEFYCVIVRKENVTDSKKLLLTKLTSYCIKNLSGMKLSTRSAYLTFFNYSRKRNQMLVKLFPNLSRPRDYSLYQSEESSYCGYLCRRHFSDLLHLLLSLHEFNNQDETLYLIIRNGGIEANVQRIFFLVLSWILLLHIPKVEDTIYYLTSKFVEAPIRSNTIEGRTTVADIFKDWKWLLYTLCHHLELRIPRCRCKKKRSEFDIKETFLRSILSRNMESWTYQILNEHYHYPTIRALLDFF